MYTIGVDYGTESGQSGVGDIFAWLVNHAVPPVYHEAAHAAGMGLHAYLEAEAARQSPGESGLLTLDWWNGNRSTLVDADLTGLLIGATLATRAPEIYRALIGATALCRLSDTLRLRWAWAKRCDEAAQAPAP